WCYMLAFFALWSLLNGFTGENLKVEGNIRFLLKWDLILALFLGFFLLTGKMLTAIDAEAMCFGFFNLAFLLVTMSLLLFWCFAKQPGALGRTAVLLLVCSILCSNVMVLFPTFENPVYRFTDRGAASANYKKSVQRATSELPKEDFYRTDQVEYVRPDRENVITQSIPANEVMYYGNGTVAGYSSYFDSRWFELHKNLNCNNGYFKRVAVYNNDNRSRMDFLMGVRYFLGDNQASKKKTAQYAGYAFEPEQERQGVKVLKSRFETGLGYGIPAVMKKQDWLSYSPLDREQILMQAVIVPDDYTGSVPEIDPKTLQLDTEELPYEIVKEENLQVKDGKIHVEKKHGRLTLKVGEYENSELYCSAQNLKRRGDPYGDYGKKKSSKRPGVMKRLGAELTQPERKNPGSFTLTLEKDKVKKFQGNFLGSNQGFTDIDDYLTNLGYSEKGSGEVTLTFGDAGEYTFDELKFYTVSQKNFDAQAKALSEQRLAVEKNENNFISGSVHMKTDGILRMSIIHSPGWKAKVDGKPQEIFETMDCGSGIFLPAGTHQIELSYTPILWIPSLVACGIGLAALVIFALLPKKMKKNS
ncbi:MAG: YfhO family protein, partial [Oscillospiraceae bacterium]